MSQKFCEKYFAFLSMSDTSVSLVRWTLLVQANDNLALVISKAPLLDRLSRSFLVLQHLALEKIAQNQTSAATSLTSGYIECTSLSVLPLATSFIPSAVSSTKLKSRKFEDGFRA